eukprot:1989928-Pyramimonas_sp.AAC.1
MPQFAATPLCEKYSFVLSTRNLQAVSELRTDTACVILRSCMIVSVGIASEPQLCDSNFLRRF